MTSAYRARGPAEKCSDASRRRSGTAPWLALALLGATACSQAPTSSGTYHHRFALPPAKAASCFARNAEEHSSALVSEVSGRAAGVLEVVVRVKNGATYATARIESGASGATGTIALYVTSSRGNRELLDALVEGC